LELFFFAALREKFTAQHHIHRQMVGFSRVRVNRVRVRIRVRFSFSGANLNQKTLGGELLPERRFAVDVLAYDCQILHL